MALPSSSTRRPKLCCPSGTSCSAATRDMPTCCPSAFLAGALILCNAAESV
ncbi:hypothetical protein GQ55_7G095900 [Panicum hallii var. hallii]|uniref:Uncharacterized protein n=1 Tax=Panicum hallii var. hallii TaxID=1504633 RepID=A0A2T7CTE7_9POAL|nr:hypothetical protein GQ55_7G095900 [Panicum hallii var. hallii]